MCCLFCGMCIKCVCGMCVEWSAGHVCVYSCVPNSMLTESKGVNGRKRKHHGENYQ